MEDVGELAAQLCADLEAVIPGSSPTVETPAVIPNLAPYVDVLPDGRLRVAARRSEEAVVSLNCSPQRPLAPKTLTFLRHFVRLFSNDLRSISTLARDREIWVSLSETRFARAVARSSTFSTTPLVNWLSCLEAAGRQTYELQPFSGSAIFSTQLHWITDLAGDSYLPFPEPMTFEKAVLGEKWTRPLLASGDLALVGVSHTGMVRGLLAYGQESGNGALAPHHELTGLYRYLVPGTTLLFCSRHGDTFVSIPDGPTFTKSQGRWHIRDHDTFVTVLDEHLGTDIGRLVLQLALDLSFDRIGALLVFAEPQTNLAELVPDYNEPGRVSEPLRGYVEGLDLEQPAHRIVIAAAARADGAVVFDQSGRVLDAACMITEPTEARRRARGIGSLARFSGARTTAAWNASLSGLAIKVSEDGTMEVFVGGNSIVRMG